MRLWLVGGAFLFSLAFAGFVSWTRAQTTTASETDTTLDPALERELNQLWIRDPVAFAAEMEKFKTAEDFQAQQLSTLAIEQPAEYYATYVQKTQEQLEREGRASYAITDPVAATAEALRTMDAAQRLKMEQAAEAILNPRPAIAQ